MSALTVYYDGSCPLCTSEVNALAAHAHAQTFHLIDCSAPDFYDADADAASISRAAMMQLIHARDASGRWLKGVEVFVAMYRLAGFEAMARLWAHPWLRPLWDRGYPWVARHRQLLSRLGAVRVFQWLLRRRLADKAGGCDGKTCAVQHAPPPR